METDRPCRHSVSSAGVRRVPSLRNVGVDAKKQQFEQQKAFPEPLRVNRSDEVRGNLRSGS